MLRTSLLPFILLAACSAAEPTAHAADGGPLADIAPAAAAYDGVLTTVSENANWTEFNADQYLEWGRAGGDWVDANGKPWGGKAFASLSLSKASEHSWVKLDVTDAMDGHAGALFLKKGASGKAFKIDSDNAEDGSLRPYLVIDGAGGERRSPVGLTHLSSTTSKTLKDQKAASTTDGILVFPRDARLAPGERATLHLHTQRGFGNQQLKLFRAAPMVDAPPAIDIPRATRTIVGVDAGEWEDEVAKRDIERTRKDGDGRGVTPLADGTLRLHWPAGGGVQTAMSSKLTIPVEERAPLTVLSYTLMIGEDFKPGMTGKFPGLVNTGHRDPRDFGRNYGGFGGRPPADGVWTARMFQGSAKSGPYADEFSPIDTYVYSVDDGDHNGVRYGLSRPVPRREWVTLVQAVDTERGLLAHWVVTEAGAHHVGTKEGLVFYTDADVRRFGAEHCYTSEAWLNFHIGGTGYQKRRHDGHTIWLESARIHDGLPDLDAEAARLAALNETTRARTAS